jgi:hypothetical protein
MKRPFCLPTHNERFYKNKTILKEVKLSPQYPETYATYLSHRTPIPNEGLISLESTGIRVYPPMNWTVFKDC